MKKFKCEHETIEALEGNKKKDLHNFPVRKDFFKHNSARRYCEGKFGAFEYIFFNSSINFLPLQKISGETENRQNYL